MIRNVVLIKLKPGTASEQVDQVMAELRAIPFQGLIDLVMGRDAGLREGNVDLAIVSDFEDEATYRAYDADPEHNRIRRELLAPIAERVERSQIRV